MLKREVTYEDYNGNKVTETFYFNLSKAELIELEVDYEGGFSDTIQKIVEAENVKEIIAIFKRILLMSYGKKSDDGKRFIKTDQLREEFSQSAAYSTLFMELALNADAAAAFINGLAPKDLADDIQRATQKREGELPPPPPPS